MGQPRDNGRQEAELVREFRLHLLARLAVHPRQPATTGLASQWPDLTVVYVKASQTRCFDSKDIFVLQFDGERRALAGQLVVRADALALYVVGLKAGWQLG